jgi:hypothetical protein
MRQALHWSHWQLPHRGGSAVLAARVAAAATLAFLLWPVGACAQTGESPKATPAAQSEAKPELLPEAPDIRSPYNPITRSQRLTWWVDQGIGPEHIAVGLSVAAFGTARDVPYEYHGTWEGFGKRLGVRESGVLLSNAMEATLGSFWGEDPRYFRAPEESFAQRLGNVFKQTFVARYRNGSFGPAYGRYAAITGNNFISNSWRAQSEADTDHALSRTGWGFLGRMGSNAFEEFWPDVSQHLLHHH